MSNDAPIEDKQKETEKKESKDVLVLLFLIGIIYVGWSIIAWIGLRNWSILYGWGGIAIGVIMVAAAFLDVDEFKPHAKRWFPILIGVIFLVLASWQVVVLISATSSMPDLPNGIPAGVNLPEDGKIRLNQTQILLPYAVDDREPVYIQFSSVRCINGWFNGHDEVVIVNGTQVNAGAESVSKDVWGDKIPDKGIYNVWPELRANFPFTTLDKNTVHSWVPIEAKMSIEYPKDYSESSKRFTNEETNRTRHINAFVISPEEYAIIKQREGQELFNIVKPALVVPIALLLIAGTGTLYTGIRRNRKPKKPT